MKKYKKPNITTYKDMKEFVLLHICYTCPFNKDETPADYHCVNINDFMGDDCPIWSELRYFYL